MGRILGRNILRYDLEVAKGDPIIKQEKRWMGEAGVSNGIRRSL